MKDYIHYHRVNGGSDLILSEGFYAEYEFKPHYHLDYHIGLVLDGVQRQQFQGQSVLLGPGCISVMPPGEVHDGSGYDRNAYRMRTFRISPALLADNVSELTGKLLQPFFAGKMVEDAQLASQLVKLFDSIQQPDKLDTMAVEQAWLSLFEPLWQRLSVVKPQVVSGGLSLQELQRVRDYCDEYLADKISLEQLATLCGLSRYQFLRRFERSTGLTPHNWLTQLRLEKACLLLRQPEFSLTQIALRVGFYDQSHFIRSFRKGYGIAPSQY
ncbi:MAG: AraC family transcriptional regulator [Marinobacterium sp.]|nr:AraC family transcriptional regulator [Marinobacterium sp.]